CGSRESDLPMSDKVPADRLLPGVARQLRVEQRGRDAVLAHLVRPDAGLFEQTVPDPVASGRLRLDEDVARSHMLLIAADRADVEIAGQPLAGVAEGDAVVDGLDDGCEIRRPRSRTDAGTAATEVVTAGPTAIVIASPGSAVAGSDAAGSPAAGSPAAVSSPARASRWPAEDGVDEFAVAVCQRQR